MNAATWDRPLPAGREVLKQCALVAAAFVALDVIYALTTGQVAYQGAALIQHIPLRDVLVEQWRDGVVPTWTSSVGAGHPIYSDSTTLPLDPRNLLIALFGAVDGYIIAGIATRALAASIAFAYLRRRVRASAWASFLGAMVFLSGTSLLEEGTALAGALLLPGFIWLSERLYEKLTVRRVVALAGAWALLIVANSAADTPYFALACVVWVGLLAWWRDDRLDRGLLLRFLVAFGVAGAVGLALAAIVVLPSAEVGSLSNRGGEYRSDPFALDSLLALFFGANDRTATDLPFLGTGYFYIGVISFAPIVAALHSRGNPYVRAGLTMGLGTIVLLLFGFLAKPELIEILPGLASVPLFRLALLLGFAAAVLVAIGLDRPDWLVSGRERLVVGALFLLQAAILVGVVVVDAPLLVIPLLLVGVRALGLGIALVLPRGGPSLRVAGFGLRPALVVGALLAVELAVAWGVARPRVGLPYRATPEVGYLQASTDRDLRAMEILVRPGWPDPLPGAYAGSLSLVQNAPAFEGIPTANVYASLVAESYSDTFDDFGDFAYRRSIAERAPNAYMTTSRYDSPLLRALGVGYLYSTSRFPSPGLSRHVFTGEGYHVYAIREPLPRAYFAGEARWLPDDGVHTELRRIAAGEQGAIRLGPEVLLEGEARTEGRAAYAPATVLEDDGSSVEVLVDAPREGFLVLSDVDLPGWSAEVDGEEAEIERANGFARAVRVAAGQHTVRFEYTPAGLKAGAAISALTAALCLLALGAALIRRKSRMRR